MTKDLKHLDVIISMIQTKKNEMSELILEIKALERSQYLLEKT